MFLYKQKIHLSDIKPREKRKQGSLWREEEGLRKLGVSCKGYLTDFPQFIKEFVSSVNQSLNNFAHNPTSKSMENLL